MRKYLKFFESVDDPCQKRTWAQHHRDCVEENLGKISKHSISVARKMISHLEELLGHEFDDMDLSFRDFGNHSRIGYQRLGMRISIYQDQDYWFFVELRFSNLDKWAYQNFYPKGDIRFYWKCDQDIGLSMIPDKLMKEVK